MPFRLQHNLTILGPPGSGKGYYGRHLASAWQVPLVSVSSVLRQNAALRHVMRTGGLVKDETVVQVLGDYLEQTIAVGQHFLLDGFPRTASQIHLWSSSSSHHHQLHAALHLHIPDTVCMNKSLGRRFCTNCHDFVNIAHVQTGKFDLPPTFPVDCPYNTAGGRSDTDDVDRPCTPHWTTRPDDTLCIIRDRLQLYHEHQDPIIYYYRRSNRLLQVTPYKGLPDVPQLQADCETWLKEHVNC